MISINSSVSTYEVQIMQMLISRYLVQDLERTPRALETKILLSETFTRMLCNHFVTLECDSYN